jgi:hypothetical protein
MIMVTVGTYIAGRHVFRDGFAGAGWSWGKPKYYVAVIGLALLLGVVPTIFDLALGLSKRPYKGSVHGMLDRDGPPPSSRTCL